MNKDNLADLDYEAIQEMLEQEKMKSMRNEEDRRNREKDRSRHKDRRDYENRDREKDKRDKDRRDDKYRERSRERKRDDRRKDDKRKSRSRSRDKRRSRSRDTKEDRLVSYKNRKDDKEKLLLDKTIEEARKQALEAQRDDCTVLVYRLHLNAKEKDLFTFFAKENIGRIQDIKIVRDQRTRTSKGVAYVEFESQESVLLACALSGQPICGQAVVITQSQAEKNRAALAAKYKKEMIKEQHRLTTITSSKSYEYVETDVPMKIFVGGLTEHLADITEQDLRSIFSFGDIDFIDLHKDPMTGKSRGYAFIQYRKSSQAKAAISAMNGFNYKGKILRVGEASQGLKNGNELFLPSGEFEDSSYLHNIQSRQTLSQKLSKDNGSAFPISMPQTGNTPNANVGATNCIVLCNLFEPNKINLSEDPTFYEDVEEDVYEECSKFGSIDKISLDKVQGRIFLKYSNNNIPAAKLAFDKLNGRWFASRPIKAMYITESVFNQTIP